MKRRVCMCEDTKAMLNKKVTASCMGKVCLGLYFDCLDVNAFLIYCLFINGEGEESTYES